MEETTDKVSAEEGLERLDALVAEALSGETCLQVTKENVIFEIRFVKWKLFVLSQWRLLDKEVVVVPASRDTPSEDTIQYLHETLAHCSVEKTRINGPWNALTITFDNGFVLQTISDSEYHENWNLFHGPVKMIISGPGELWSHWE